MATTLISKRSDAGSRRWADLTNLTLGAFLAASPWLSLGGDPIVSWNALTCGALVIVAASIALSGRAPWAEWSILVIGGWLLIAPWQLNFSAYAGATWTSVLVGLGLLCIAGFQLWAMSRRLY